MAGVAGGRQRIDGQRAYVLHTYPYSETSLVLDVFSREHGRLPLLARGARRPRSALRGVLQAFQPLEIGWFGGGEVRTLARAEWLGGTPLLGGTALLLGYYLNELLLKLLPRDDAHQRLFDDYASIMQQLARQGREHGHTAPLLRRFEQSLLAELGYGLSLTQEAQTGTPVQAAGRYHYRVEQGPVALAPGEAEGMPDGQVLYGKTLLDMANNDYTDPRTLAEAKQLMRTLIHHHLAGKPLQSRRIFVELMELS